MSTFKITGGTPLYGSVRLGGAKNASYKLMIASLLGEGESRLLNFSHILDVELVADVIQSLGGVTTKRGERTMFIQAGKLKSWQIEPKYGPASRSAPMFIPVLLHRFGKAVVPLPGGDKIGKRPLERHFEGLVQMGAKISLYDDRIEATAHELSGAEIIFEKNTHTGTETLIMAAVLAKGTTLLRNAALEPEVDDLIFFLNQMGGRIRRRYHRIIEIEGVPKLKSTIHRVMPDRNEAVSYACAAIATRGDIIVENANREHLESFLEKLEEINAGYEIGPYGIRFYYKGDMRAADVVTQPHPGFMTDWQPLWALLLTQAKGQSVIHETIYPDRFQYIDQLKLMGAKIEQFDPEVDNPEKVYNFNWSKELTQSAHAIRIEGPTQLRPATCTVQDLRHGATIVIASIIAPGTSTIHNVEQIDRGYEELDSRLNSLGANIVRS